jgi:hypothetical protein
MVNFALGELFEPEHYERKVETPFGNRANLFKRSTSNEFQKRVLRLALEGVRTLRNSAYHFKGLADFADALTSSKPDLVAEDVAFALRGLWEADLIGRAERLVKTMREAHFEYFFNESENRAILAASSNQEPVALPLPRLRRVLLRTQNAWGEGPQNLGFPGPPNRTELEKPARLCQYTALKLVYERAFRRWLYERSAAMLNDFIDRAVNRSTAEARALNAGDNEDLQHTLLLGVLNVLVVFLQPTTSKPSFLIYLRRRRPRCGFNAGTQATRKRRVTKRIS